MLQSSHMKELWVALVELLTPPNKDGDTRCYTQVVAWAENPEDYKERITCLFKKSACSVLEVEQCARLAELDDLTEELERQAERARIQPEDCIFGTLNYYPSGVN